MEPIFQVKHLCFDYAETPLLENIQFELPSGHLLHLKGDNGSGKTTLLKLIAGILSAQKGDIYFKNRSISEDKPAYQRNLCYVGHKSGIHAALSPRENAHFDLHQGRRALDWGHAMKALSLNGLDDTPCGQLSAGQRRRVSLLRLLMSDAQLWLLDEPFVALDLQAQLFLMNCIQEHLKSGGIVILTSHQPLPGSVEHSLEYQL